ncbi:MAG: DNA polymerase domain-containing protein [Actinomycetota bacterium]|nr:DNA polymerase domain-containing protein [Actinomycetota bacterium]
MAPAGSTEELPLDGHTVTITNPDKIFFPEIDVRKIDLVRYYLAVAPGVLAGCKDRPTTLKRYPNGAARDFFYQKRVPLKRPEWLRTVMVTFPSGRSAEFLCIDGTAALAWAINLGCIDINPWPVRRQDVDHPDELRVDLDPQPDVPFDHVRQVALIVREVLEDHGLTGFPKTSGSRGIHINARIEPRWDFSDVRLAALALGREVERRAPSLATTAWWKEQRHGVFVDYNQNARDRTVASAYSVRPTPDARVSCPLDWSEVPTAHLRDFRIDTVPARFAERGDPGQEIDEHVGSIDSLLELAERQKAGGAEEAPWPPHFPKAKGEPPRVAPSRAKKRRA